MSYKDKKFLCFKWGRHTHHQERVCDSISKDGQRENFTALLATKNEEIKQLRVELDAVNQKLREIRLKEIENLQYRMNQVIVDFIQKQKVEGSMTAKTKEREQVDLIASGYEWECPNCEHLNNEIEVTQTVKCKQCGNEYDVADYEHAIG